MDNQHSGFEHHKKQKICNYILLLEINFSEIVNWIYCSFMINTLVVIINDTIVANCWMNNVQKTIIWPENIRSANKLVKSVNKLQYNLQNFKWRKWRILLTLNHNFLWSKKTNVRWMDVLHDQVWLKWAIVKRACENIFGSSSVIYI